MGKNSEPLYSNKTPCNVVVSLKQRPKEEGLQPLTEPLDGAPTMARVGAWNSPCGSNANGERNDQWLLSRSDLADLSKSLTAYFCVGGEHNSQLRYSARVSSGETRTKHIDGPGSSLRMQIKCTTARDCNLLMPNVMTYR